ncbi:MAG: hypothetical protein ACOX21_01045 [Bacillota bacterium]|jgi:hypothetical protein|nr:extracellular solute-binding protein [Bacillota bacterium]HOC06239.1 extracellular solute-binding protein [Bacillota bacterium]HPZ21818.1 extracellular solute-binding protein [Bacillota bacterium]HQD19412.1 extracellular solute-binding protein [Bacillota bacterium]
MAAKIIPLSLCLILFANCFGAAPETVIDPDAALDAERTYIVEYWDVELPRALDPQSKYRPGVEKALEEFCAANPGIDVRLRWLQWTEAGEELARVLRDGNPPDIFADWQGIARSDHLLQIPASTWLDKEHLTAAGKNMSTHEGKIWSWPLMFWPLGLLVMESRCGLSMEELEAVIRSPWDWPQFAQWLESKGLQLLANDWESEFAAQALVASTGRSWGQWGGQELHQVFTGLKLVVDGGLVHKGRDTQILQGEDVIGGTTPALMFWLKENYPEEQVLLLPLPAAGSAAYLPISGVNLLQFRQLRYKGDDHARAAAMVAEFLAQEQGSQLAGLLMAASPWRDSPQESPEVPAWYSLLLREAKERGVPSRRTDKAGVIKEQEARRHAAILLAQFWAGEISPEELARGFEEFQ